MTKYEAVDATGELPVGSCQLSFWRKAIHYALGQYTESTSRKAQRRQELGPSGRIIEDIVSAVSWTRQLNRTQVALAEGTWITASQSGESDTATMPITLHELSDEVALLNLFSRDGGNLNPGSFNGIGFEVARYGKLRTSRKIAAVTQEICVFACNGASVVDAIALTRDEIDSLAPEIQGALEGWAAEANSYAQHLYHDHEREPGFHPGF